MHLQLKVPVEVTNKRLIIFQIVLRHQDTLLIVGNLQ